MIKNLNEYLIGFVAGIRFRANFSIEDRLGKIIDTVLYSKNAYFNPNVFPKVVRNVGQKLMYNPTTDDRLSIDNSNFILEIQFGHNDGFEKEKYNEILKNFNKQIIADVMSKFKIQQIVRIGLVNRYLFPLNDLAQSFVDKTIGKTLEGVNDMAECQRKGTFGCFQFDYYFFPSVADIIFGFATYGKGQVSSFSFSEGICSRIFSYKYQERSADNPDGTSFSGRWVHF